MKKPVSVFATMLLALVVASCGSSDNNKQAALEPVRSAMGVNAWLWQATMDTLHFMPMRSADPSSAVIITDWYVAPDNMYERVQVNVRFISEDLRSDGVKVHVVRQLRKDDQWVAADVQASTELEIEEAILSRARQLRVESLN